MDFEAQRKKLIDLMVESGCLKSEDIINAFLKVKREEFFLPDLKDASYVDSAFPIGYGQTISQPSTIAIMLELLMPMKGQKVLEIGSGSGYVLALLSEIVGKDGKIIGVERVAELANRAKHTLAKLGYNNVKIIISDGSKGLPQEAPFDRILVSAACSSIPEHLIKQLAVSGRLVAPVGSRFSQQLQVVEKNKKGNIKSYFAPGYFVFVPLVSD
ncbi:MAG: protein-L-isoaspartate(D-aspartate) O-methyltransferase [Candidatus Diapherotrites archaeon]